MAEIIWSEEAMRDLESIYDYISRDSPSYARRQIETIQAAVLHLAQFPNSGRHLPEFPRLPHRELITGNYRVIYRDEPEKQVVIVVTVVHGARLLGSR